MEMIDATTAAAGGGKSRHYPQISNEVKATGEQFKKHSRL